MNPRPVPELAEDIALAAFAFEVEAIQQASAWEVVTGVTVQTCSAEHLLVYKLVAARPQDLVDVESIVRRQGRLDVEANPLLGTRVRRDQRRSGSSQAL